MFFIVNGNFYGSFFSVREFERIGEVSKKMYFKVVIIGFGFGGYIVVIYLVWVNFEFVLYEVSIYDCLGCIDIDDICRECLLMGEDYCLVILCGS